MKITIITPVLNARRTIEGTIRSVQMQNYPDVEHLVVDGGSTDGTLEIVRGFEAPGLLWTSEPDEGITDAFNKGIARSTGEVIGIINADDQLWPDALRHVCEGFQRHHNADLIYGNCVYEESRDRRFISLPDPGLRTVRRRFPLKHPTVFVRRSAYERFGMFDPAYRLAMDYELILRFHTSGASFVYVDEILALVRAAGVSERRVIETIREVRSISVRYGYPRVLAYPRSWASMGYRLLKRGMERGKLAWAIDRYRARSPRFRPPPEA